MGPATGPLRVPEHRARMGQGSAMSDILGKFIYARLNRWWQAAGRVAEIPLVRLTWRATSL